MKFLRVSWTSSFSKRYLLMQILLTNSPIVVFILSLPLGDNESWNLGKSLRNLKDSLPITIKDCKLISWMLEKKLRKILVTALVLAVISIEDPFILTRMYLKKILINELPFSSLKISKVSNLIFPSKDLICFRSPSVNCFSPDNLNDSTTFKFSMRSFIIASSTEARNPSRKISA